MNLEYFEQDPDIEPPDPQTPSEGSEDNCGEKKDEDC